MEVYKYFGLYCLVKILSSTPKQETLHAQTQYPSNPIIRIFTYTVLGQNSWFLLTWIILLTLRNINRFQNGLKFWSIFHSNFDLFFFFI